MITTPETYRTPSKKQEYLVFLSTAFLIVPGLAVVFVGVFGLVIWLSQLIGGPPGPPA